MVMVYAIIVLLCSILLVLSLSKFSNKSLKTATLNMTNTKCSERVDLKEVAISKYASAPSAESNNPASSLEGSEDIQPEKKPRTKKSLGMFLKHSYIYLILFLMYAPTLVLIIFSFTDSKLVGTWHGFSFKLYEQLFKNSEIMLAVRNTFMIAISSAAVSTLIGTAGAIGIFYSKKRIRQAYEVVGKIPVLNPEIVIALSLTILFVAIGAKFNFITLLIGHVVLTIPFVVLSITPKLKQLDPNTYEAALDLGAKPATALRKVIIPEILPGIFSGFILAVTLSLDDYIITAFTKNPSFTTLSTYIYGATSKKGNLPPALRALTTIIFLVTLGVLLLLNFYNKRNKQKKEGRK